MIRMVLFKPVVSKSSDNNLGVRLLSCSSLVRVKSGANTDSSLSCCKNVSKSGVLSG